MLLGIHCRSDGLKVLLAAGCLVVSAGAGDLQGTLQSAVDLAMAGNAGTAIVLDVASGRMLAHHRLDIAARRLAAPGSAIKPFTLLALLGSGRFDPHQRLLCPRKLDIAGRRLDCSHPEVPSGFDAAEALAYSCNSYFAKFASQLGEEDLIGEFKRAGLLSSTGLSAGEVVGAIRRPANDEQLKLLALGEDGIVVTPLELLSAYRRLALRQKVSNKSDAVWETVAEGLKGSTDYGMAQAAEPNGFAVAGKTGTAGSSTSPLTHGWFVGYAPADNPEVVLVVYLEKGRGMDAAARARRVFVAFQQARGAR